MLEKLKLDLKPGRYIVAVSGGVDSVALLHLLATRYSLLQLEVAHVDHGWRDGRAEHRLVEAMAKASGLGSHFSKLPPSKSEAEARKLRYHFFDELKKRLDARGVITAHHLDDRIETVVLQLLRGSGRQGLSVLAPGRGEMIRPLLSVRKSEVLKYARVHNLNWIEDPTNADRHFRRNWVRLELLPQLRRQDPRFDQRLLEIINRAETLNRQIDARISEIIPDENFSLSSDFLRRLPLATLTNVLAVMAAKASSSAELDSASINSLAVDIKAARFKRRRQLGQRLSATPASGKITIRLQIELT